MAERVTRCSNGSCARRRRRAQRSDPRGPRGSRGVILGHRRRPPAVRARQSNAVSFESRRHCAASRSVHRILGLETGRLSRNDPPTMRPVASVQLERLIEGTSPERIHGRSHPTQKLRVIWPLPGHRQSTSRSRGEILRLLGPNGAGRRQRSGSPRSKRPTRTDPRTWHRRREIRSPPRPWLPARQSGTTAWPARPSPTSAPPRRRGHGVVDHASAPRPRSSPASASIQGETAKVGLIAPATSPEC